MAYAQPGPYGSRRLAAPKPDFIPGGMTARSVGDRIRSQINRTQPDPEEARRRWEYEQRRGLFEAIAPKVDWSNPDAVKGVQAFIESFAPASPATAAKPEIVPVTSRPGGRLAPTTRGLQEQGLTTRPGGLVMPTTRAVQGGATPGPINEMSDWGKQELARRAAMVTGTQFRADEVARRKKEGTWTGGRFITEGVVEPETRFERRMQEKRFPLARTPARAAATESVDRMKAELEQVNSQLQTPATPDVGIQEGPTGGKTALRERRDYLIRRIGEVEGTVAGPEQRMTETPTGRALDYITQTLPAIRRAEQIDAEIKVAREAHQNITSGAAMSEAMRAFRDSTDLRSQQAAAQRIRDLTGPDAKKKAWDRVVALAREKRDLETQAAQGPQAPSATELGKEQVEIQTDIARRGAPAPTDQDIAGAVEKQFREAGVAEPTDEQTDKALAEMRQRMETGNYAAQRRGLIEAGRAGFEGSMAASAAAQAAAAAPTPFPAKEEGLTPSQELAREKWNYQKAKDVEAKSKDYAIDPAVEALFNGRLKEFVKPTIKERKEWTPPGGMTAEEKRSFIEDVRRWEREGKRKPGFADELERAEFGAPSEAGQGAAQGAEAGQRGGGPYQNASDADIESALDEAGDDAEEAEAILNRKGLTGRFEG